MAASVSIAVAQGRASISSLGGLAAKNGAAGAARETGRNSHDEGRHVSWALLVGEVCLAPIPVADPSRWLA